MVVGGAGVLLGPAISAGSEVQNELESHVSVAQTPVESSEPCLPGALALSNTVASTADIFQLTITASADPCDPITAHAVVYAMPGNGLGPWPQTLMEKETFTIDSAGVTVVTFSKDCLPMQFDVVTGATPAVISPDGEVHGPLLFPFDTGTAQQFFGKTDCAEVLPSTSIAGPTTTEGETTETTELSPTTTEEPEVLGTSSIPSDTVANNNVANNDVATTAAAVQSAAQVAGTQALAVTGASNSQLVLLGGGMILAGAGLTISSRRGIRS